MAHKRMFSKDITGSDAFREMPQSSQNLYFHLGMDADDDGFLDNYKGIIRAVNASEDDLKVLITKRFLILFPSKVIVVKHWKINNTIQKDRYHETKYLEEKNGLVIKENGSYTERIQPVSIMETQDRIGKDRIIPAKADSSETHIEDEDDQKDEKKSRGRDKLAQALTYRCYEKMENEYGVKPTSTFADYLRVLEAQKVLKDSDILLMVEDALAVGKAKTLREMLTNREIDIYRQQNV